MSEPATNDLIVSVTGTPRDSDVATIQKSLTAFNEADAGPANMIAIAVLVRDADDALVAGIYGNTAWNWLYVQSLWVAESYRGRGLAGRMLAAAEDEARKRGCHSAYIDTFSPIALKAYQRAGFQTFGALENFFMGRTRTFLQKKL